MDTPMIRLFVIAQLLGVTPAAAAHWNAAGADSSPEAPKVHIGYGEHGWEFRTANDRYVLQFQSRLQFRYAYSRDSDPLSIDDFDETGQALAITRARLKIGGHAYEPWLRYYWEYELQAGNLLDFRLMVERWPWLKLKVGQWKTQYNRERIISSGKQQMADRSLINRPFTVDRQQGVSLFGRLKGRGVADFNYWLSVLTGTGRGSRNNDDNFLMYMGRAQWSVFGRVVPFAGSDTQHHEQPAGLIAFAAVTNRSSFTRFSQAGGGDLEGFEPGDPGQYRINQALEETALMFRGLSWQQELHWKEIIDHKNATTTRLMGNYAQLGYFLHGALQTIPRQLEIAFRHALYDPNRAQGGDLQQEYSGVANWFVRGHLNKITFEITRFQFEVPGEDDRSDWRLRLQWDISI